MILLIEVALFASICLSFEQPDEPRRHGSHRERSHKRSHHTSSRPSTSHHRTQERPTTSTSSQPSTSTTSGKHTHKRKHTTHEDTSSQSKHESKRQKLESSSEQPSTSKQTAQSSSTREHKDEPPKQIPYPPYTYLLPTTITYLENHRKCLRYYPLKKGKYDFLVLVQYWPGERCAHQLCTIPKTTKRVKEKFFLHGLWPSIFANRNIFCCRNKFSYNSVEKRLLNNQKLLKSVQKHWFSSDKCKSSMYQYDKHGTCSLTTFSGGDGPVDYFNTAIKMYRRINIWKVLRRSKLKVRTNKLYDIEKLRDVVRKAYGAKPTFFCKEGTSLYEIRVCYDPSKKRLNPEPINCPNKFIKFEEQSCHKRVMLKEFPGYLLDPSIIPRNNCEY
ncbi:intracellular ribonuclease LX precursor, putative [Entamoeba invadens IP1]|uniref:Intracellular ribonuclease LX, putative n=1 Tax=Entamoeba invadens IP1 TaxID=370355 RepID=A0A0A1U1Q3_ENTIV|nr:intracellular ribonuclease LX precursor, putative [Entamoeba invadens IP1]ELP86542.1 intracellular ribonuclease LX precursor, putative [Entamoeba invadens IP1]|eukprot:XP_004185888.1 intracellular ribonuclease LX precursor, putative [Entamoeba invadens IP1]